MDTILVTGGTGTLGRGVVHWLQEHQQTVRVLSHRPQPQVPPGVAVVQGDMVTGAGLAAAVAGARTIIHTASNQQRAGDVAGTQRLLAAAQAAHVAHFVYISIVGIDQHPFAYYRLKREAESSVENSGIPWTILRTTQFHGLIWRILAAQDRSPVVLIPRGWRFQPIDEGEVAAALAQLALGAPAGRVPDMGGPQIRTTIDLAKSYLHIRQRRRPIITVPILGKAGHAFHTGVHLAPERMVGHITWDAYVTQRSQQEA